jgi:lipid-binding SYLF domain-containing protein
MYAEPLFVLIAFVSLFIAGGAPRHENRAVAATSARLQGTARIVEVLPGRSRSDGPTAQAAQTDCVAVIPGFANDTPSNGTASGQGFVTCRAGHHWSAPSAIVLEGSSSAMLADGGKTDVVLLLKDRSLRESLLSGAVLSGDAAEETSESKLFFHQTKHTFAEFTLANAAIRPDGPVNELLYGKSLTPSAILEGKRWPPTVAAQDFVDQVVWRFR